MFPATNVRSRLYHFGVNFVANLLGQGFYVAAQATADLCCVIGPNIDLLLWIPKEADAEHPDGQRPLQLPPCLRRLFSSGLMEVVGPAV